MQKTCLATMYGALGQIMYMYMRYSEICIDSHFPQTEPPQLVKPLCHFLLPPCAPAHPAPPAPGAAEEGRLALQAMAWQLDFLRRSLLPLQSGLGLFRSDDDALAIRDVLVLALLFEAVNVAVRAVIRLAGGPEAGGSPLGRHGGCYASTMVMALWTSVRGTVLFLAFLGLPEEVQYTGVVRPGADTEAALLAHVSRTNTVFLAYLIFDATHVVASFGDYAKADMLVHHVGFIICSAVCQHYQAFFLPFTILIQGEWSTVFLELRWVLRQLGRSSRAVDVSFAVSFFATRILLYGFMLWHILSHLSALGTHPSMPLPLGYLIVAILCGFFFLNISWFGAILRIARGKRGTRAEKTKSR